MTGRSASHETSLLYGILVGVFSFPLMTYFDYFSLRPADIETPEATYGRFRFLFAYGVGQIINDRKTQVVRELPGSLVRTLDREWVFTADGGETWRIVDGGGCNCKGGVVQRR